MAEGQTGGAGKGPDFDLARFFSELKLPTAFDMQAFTDATRRNLEAITAANRVALEGAQAVARRQMEIMQQAMSEMTDAMRALTGSEAPQDKAARQAELLKNTYQRAVSHIQELSEMIQRSNGEAVALLNKRFTEAMDEMKALAKKGG
jgi:phasin family protein